MRIGMYMYFLSSLVSVVASAFVPLNEQGVSIPAIRFHFNMYTGPVYLSALLDIINIILIVALFREYKLDLRTEKEKTRSKAVKQETVVSYMAHVFFLLIL